MDLGASLDERLYEYIITLATDEERQERGKGGYLENFQMLLTF